MIDVNDYSTPVKDFNDLLYIEKTYGDLIIRGAPRGRLDGIQYFQIKRNGEVYTVLYKDQQNILEVSEKDYTENGEINYDKIEQIMDRFIEESK